MLMCVYLCRGAVVSKQRRCGERGVEILMRAQMREATRRIVHSAARQPQRPPSRWALTTATKLVIALASMLALGAAALPAGALAALPDGRAYEMVTPPSKNGVEVGAGIASTDGNSVNWEAIGGCCGATSSASTLYQSARTATGWQTVAKTPTPPGPLEGLFEEQQPMWWSGDLTKTIYITPASYASGDQRPAGPGATSYDDLYEQGSDGAMTWLTQGPFAGAGKNPDTATFAAATPDGNSVLFNSQEQLNGDASGLASLNTPPEFLYDRNISAGTTALIDITTTLLRTAASPGDTTITVNSTEAFLAGQTVTIGSGATSETDTIASVPSTTQLTLSTGLVSAHSSGAAVEALISPDGAIAGNGNWLDQPFLPADYYGTTTNSISSDGSKVFFESPPTFEGGGGGAEGVGPAHLYMRDVATSSTTPLDDPSSSGSVQYEGASQDGSLVFFTSTEGLGGNSNTDNELYEFNTTASRLGPAPAMSAISLSGDSANDGNVVGVTAISNDGSHVYFVAEGVLASNKGAQGKTATQGALNFYVVNTATGDTTFIATLGSGVAGDNRDKTALTGEPDISRAAVPTPDGTVLAFESSANLTSQNPSGPTTTLTADTTSQTNDTAVSIPVASTTGFIAGRTVEIVTPTYINESATITGIPDSTHLLVSDSGIGLLFPHNSGDSVIQRPPFEVYRYATTGNAITCVSCTPAGVKPTGSAGLGASGGGTYGPSGQGVPMSSDGSRIFFDSPDPLTPGVISSPPIPTGVFGGLTFVSNVYEWENGTVSLISDGQSTTGSSLGSTTLSGDDVFFTSEDQLVPQDADGYDDIYDARVGGGFPAPATPPPACGSANTCRTSVAPVTFFPVPSSTTLIEPNVATPSFTVSSISGGQRKRFASSGRLTLTVTVGEAGRITATGSAVLKGIDSMVASATKALYATDGGKATLTLRLSKAARKALASKHKLVVRIAVSYTGSNQVNIASVTLTTKGKSKKATNRRSALRRRARER